MKEASGLFGGWMDGDCGTATISLDILFTHPLRIYQDSLPTTASSGTMSNVKPPQALAQNSLARNPSLQAIRNRSNTHHSIPIPVPPSLRDKPHLHAMTLPPPSAPYRNTPQPNSASASGPSNG